MAKIFKVPFAATGDKTVVPIPTQADGSVSWTQGYGFDYQRKLDGSDPLAKPFPRNQHNQILNDITTALGEIQVNGSALWNAEGAPYPANAKVRHNGINYISKISNNSSTPADGSSWGIDGYISQATETVEGIAKIATSAQALAGVDNTTIMTPAKTKAVIAQAAATQATESVLGIAKIATAQQALAGVDNTTIMTPLKVASRVASETAVGQARIATDAQAQAGVDDNVIITPLKLKNAYGLGDSFALTDLNDTRVGFWMAAGNVPNAPGGTGILHGMTRGSPSKSGTFVQIALDASTGITYTRVFAEAAWKAWESQIGSSRIATEAVTGIVALATASEASAGTNAAKAMSAARTVDAIARRALGSARQTPTILDGSRLPNVTYTNSTGAPIAVSAVVSIAASTQGYLVIGGVNFIKMTYATAGGIRGESFFAIIPDGATYRTVGIQAIQSWSELQ